jgi:hypothetical protein
MRWRVVVLYRRPIGAHRRLAKRVVLMPIPANLWTIPAYFAKLRPL